MLHPISQLILRQLQFDIFPFTIWIDSISLTLNLFFALVIKGYLIFILIGFMVYMTGLYDGFAKALISIGITIYFIGPFIINLIAQRFGASNPTAESAINIWNMLFNMSESDFIGTLVILGDMLMYIGLLLGAILFFIPSSNDLKARGQSLIVRSLMMFPILSFFHITTLI